MRLLATLGLIALLLALSNAHLLSILGNGLKLGKSNSVPEDSVGELAVGSANDDKLTERYAISKADSNESVGDVTDASKGDKAGNGVVTGSDTGNGSSTAGQSSAQNSGAVQSGIGGNAGIGGGLLGRAGIKGGLKSSASGSTGGSNNDTVASTGVAAIGGGLDVNIVRITCGIQGSIESSGNLSANRLSGSAGVGVKVNGDVGCTIGGLKVGIGGNSNIGGKVGAGVQGVAYAVKKVGAGAQGIANTVKQVSVGLVKKLKDPLGLVGARNKAAAY